ncbi:MAG: hypothetical protein CL843_20115 [Crocinitomicaceae bacterium]|nr:hypothetical protein [Crocinitomicaceae bacterium]
MKKVFFLLAVIILSSIVFAVSKWQNSHFSKTEKFPAPSETIVLNKGDKEEKEWKEQLEREEWINRLHKTAPDADWRSIDQQTRYMNLLRKSSNTRSNIDTLANGFLTGFWKERGSVNQSGRIVFADYDTSSNAIYAASDGGTIFKGSLNGSNWTPITDHFNISGIDYLAVLNQTSSPRIFVAAGKYCYFSDDDGTTWTTSTGINAVTSWGDIRKAAVLNQDNENIYLLIQEWDYTNWEEIISIYYSQNRGTSFSKLVSYSTNQMGSINQHDFWADRYQGNTLYYIQQDRVFKVQGNVTQQIGSIGALTNDRSMITGTNVGGNLTLYAYIDQDIYQSINGAASWIQKANVARNPFRQNSFAASYSNANAVFFGGVNCARSLNGFSSWEEVNQWYDYYGSISDKLHADIPAVIPFFDENGVAKTFICTDGGLYISDDNLQTVENLSLHGLNCSQYYDVYTYRAQPQYIYAGAQDQGFQRASQDTADILGFEQTVSGDYAHIVSSDSGASMWFVYPGFAAYNDDATTGNWDVSGDFDGRGNYWLPPLCEHPTIKSKVYMAGDDPNGGTGAFIYELTANLSGNNVSYNQLPADVQALTGGQISAFTYSPLDTDYWYALMDNGTMVYSTDNMSNWNVGGLNNGPEAHYFHGASIYASKAKFGRVIAAGSGYSNPGVWVSEDHGVTWEQMNSGLPQTLTFMIDATPDDSLIFAATEVGPYVFVAKDSMWYSMSSDAAPDQRYWSVEWINASKTVRFGTYGRGIWDFSFAQESDTTDTTSVNNLSGLNEQFHVYPNPAKDQLTVQSEQAKLRKVDIYDINGRVVAQIYPTDNTTTINLSHLVKGTYFVHLHTQTEHSIQKIIKL